MTKSIEKSIVFSKNHNYLYPENHIKAECDEHLFSPAIYSKLFVCVLEIQFQNFQSFRVYQS